MLEIGDVNFHAFGVSDEACEETIRHCQNFGSTASLWKVTVHFMVSIIANMLYSEFAFG